MYNCWYGEDHQIDLFFKFSENNCLYCKKQQKKTKTQWSIFPKSFSPNVCLFHLCFISFSLSGSYNHVTDEAVLQTDDSIVEEDGDHGLHHYSKVSYLIINSK